MRSRVVSVRLTPAEVVAWREAAAEAGYREVATWARGRADAVVASWPVGERPGAVGRVRGPESEVWAWSQASTLADWWNRAVERLHTFGELEAVRVEEICRWAGEAERGVWPVRVGPQVAGWVPSGTRSRLVNVRLDAREWAAWSQAAADDGWARAGAWCRAVVGASIGVRVLPDGLLPVARDYVYVHRQVAGIVMNLAQAIGSGRVDEATRARLRVAQEQAQEVLHRLNAARVP